MSIRCWFAALTVVAAAALLTGCAAEVSPQPGVANAFSKTSASRAKPHPLLYAVDGASESVGIYTYPKARELRSITGLGEPAGLCVGVNGSVWVTYALLAARFPHGSTKPISTVNVSGYDPAGCTSDPNSGDLAISALCSSSCGEGAVLIYKGGSGQGKAYTCSTLYRYYFAAYDGSGDLFVDGSDESGNFGFCELPGGGSKLVPVSLKRAIGFAGDIAWDGKYLTIADQLSGTIYRLAIQHQEVKVAGTVTLNGAPNDIVDYFLLFNGPNADRILVSQNYGIDLWKYPAGGQSLKTIPVGYGTSSFVVSE